MKLKTLLKNASLSEDALEQIKEAITKAEKNTSGEICIALTAESSSYSFWELNAALCTSFALFVCIFPMAPQIYSWLEKIFWGTEPWYLLAFYVITCAAFTFFLYLLFNIPWIDRLVIPKKVMKKAVTARAMRHFTEGGVYCTKEHSGVLIFISWFEKEVRILADKGISQKISGDLWKIIADELTENLSKGNIKDAFVNSIEKCGALLAENYPAVQEKTNQLNDDLIILEDEPWA